MFLKYDVHFTNSISSKSIIIVYWQNLLSAQNFVLTIVFKWAKALKIEAWFVLFLRG